MKKRLLFSAFMLASSACLLAQSLPQGLPSDVLHWHFPLTRTHTGILLGNGVQGLMVWGEGRELNITVGRAGFWDRRGGNSFDTRTNYQQVKQLLEANDQAGLFEAFDIKPGRKFHPQQIGGGRLSLQLPEGWTLSSGQLQLQQGTISVQASHPERGQKTLEIGQAVFHELAWVILPDDWQQTISVELKPSHSFLEATMTEKGIPAPKWSQFGEQQAHKAFLQTLPEDEPLAVALVKSGNMLKIGTSVGNDALAKAQQHAASVDWQEAARASEEWWQQYWASVPRLQLNDPIISELFYYGLYKQACATPPHGIACGLQGPFLEAYQLPPWSADYHLNINAQMIYWPSLATNRSGHLMPLWDMLLGWMPKMQQTGERFFGRKGALMMPHAVDDRGQVVGTFWTGTIDHACAAWMAQLAWLHYRYTLDEDVLRKIAWPLMLGAFEGFWAMTEEVTRNGQMQYTLPVTVSPEYKGARPDAWGRDASFQLAAYHMTAENLQQAAAVLGQPADERWNKVMHHLPPYTSMKLPQSAENPENLKERIVLWEGMDLASSHRHHSHLAGIYPFTSFDPFAPEHAAVVNNSIGHWVLTGAGAWSGWCVPWAASLHARLNNADAAVGWLYYFYQNYTNEGRGTLHDAAYFGKSVLAANWHKLAQEGKAGEIMQLDGGFGALTAIIEILVQNRRDGLHVLPDLPRDWRTFAFEKVGAEGGFQVSAQVQNAQVQQVEIHSLKGHTLVLHLPKGQWELNGQALEGRLFKRGTSPGEVLVFRHRL